MHIRNPVEWGLDQFRHAGAAIDTMGRTGLGARDAATEVPTVRSIGVADLGYALGKGFADFGAFRTDVIFLALIYPVVGLVLARLAFGYDMLPLLFPLASGFALIGPIAAIGLYEMSRRREQGAEARWADALGITQSPSFPSIAILGALLVAIYLLWLGTAATIYNVTLGPEPPISLSGFLRDVFTTGAGWTMIGIGIGVGFLFAVLVFATSVVSFPVLLDRRVGVETAIRTSLRAVAANPGPMAMWALIIAAGLVIGSIPFLLGLIIIMPVLGHATWHLYRRVVASD